jgi:hypothetical protein
VALTLVLFFFLVFTIIDLSVAIYNQGVVATASRVGARQASLFWMDPSDYSPTDTANNVRIKESMIDSAVAFYLSLLIRPSTDDRTAEYRVSGATLDPDDGTSDLVCCSAASCTVTTCVSEASVGVDITYPYSGFSAVPWIPDLPLRAVVGAAAEAEL